MGTMSSPRVSTQASASWAGVTPFSTAISWTRWTSSRLWRKFSPWKRGLLRRKSSGSRSSIDRTGLGEPHVADLSGLDQLRHGADRLLDGRFRIHPVLVVEVDVVDAETLQRGVAGLPHVLGVAADAEALPLLVADVAELRGQHDLVPASGDGAADQPFVGEWPVCVGGVQEGHAQVERPVDGRDRLALVAAAVELRHAHAAQADLRDLEPGASQVP